MNGSDALISGTKPILHKPRLLLAEDDFATRLLLHEILSPEYNVEAVTNGDQAWAAAQRELPDLVLSDLLMPGLDGIGLTRRLRTSERTASVLIMLLTVMNTHEQLLQALGAGVDDFMVKPFRPLELLARLRTHSKLIGLRRDAIERQNAVEGPVDRRQPRPASPKAARSRHLEAELLVIQEQERAELACNLHEGICQQLTGARMLVNALATDLRAVDPEEKLKQKTDQIEQYLLEATAEARRMAHELTPMEIGLEAQPFRPVLEGLAYRTFAYLGVACTVRCPEAVRWTSSVAIHLYRIAQEAITNAHRHGHARHIELRLTHRARRWRLLIIDDGTGIPEIEPDAYGTGLRTMMYRAAMIGGTLLVRNVPADGVQPGTLVCCSFAGISAGGQSIESNATSVRLRAQSSTHRPHGSRPGW